MGVLIRCNNAEFINTVGVADFPIIPELKNLYYLGETANKSIVDHSGNGNDGSFIGTETFNEHSVVFADSGTDNRMNIPLGTPEVTNVHAVALVKKTGNRGIFGAISGQIGFAFGVNRSLYKDTNQWNDLRVILDDADGFYPLAWSLTPTGITQYRLGSADNLITLGHLDGGELTANTIRRTIGGLQYNWSMNGTAEIAAIGCYEGVVSEDQLTDALLYLRTYGKLNGLTVI